MFHIYNKISSHIPLLSKFLKLILFQNKNLLKDENNITFKIFKFASRAKSKNIIYLFTIEIFIGHFIKKSMLNNFFSRCFTNFRFV